jgi:hypothetical protein
MNGDSVATDNDRLISPVRQRESNAGAACSASAFGALSL